MQGETEKYKMPQLRTQIVMPSCVYAILAQVDIVSIIPVLTHVSEATPDEHDSLDMSRVERRDGRHDLAGGPLHHHAPTLRWLHHWYCCRHHDEWAKVDFLVAVFETRECGINDFKMQGSAAIQKNLGQLQAIIVSQILPHLTTKALVHSCRSW